MNKFLLIIVRTLRLAFSAKEFAELIIYLADPSPSLLKFDNGQLSWKNCDWKLFRNPPNALGSTMVE